MEDRKRRRGTSDGTRGHHRTRHGCASPPPDRSTTARAPSSGGCSTTPSRSSRTSSRQSRPPAPQATGRLVPNLALLTDGLRAEREQGITIDVAYRYFATPTRKFIIADTPGHIQYTRNMVTGASTADLALVLVDARKGLSSSRRRHAVPGLAAAHPAPRAVRQQDGPRRLRRGVYEKIHAEFTSFATKLDVCPTSTVIPVSALQGDNVVTARRTCRGTRGPTLLHHLEHVHIASDRNLVDARFPVQYVIRPSPTSSTTTAATPGRSPVASSRRATR
jgi:sulfate adenylyltransferase subunit 1 (EFTu-like GTPase family)